MWQCCHMQDTIFWCYIHRQSVDDDGDVKSVLYITWVQWTPPNIKKKMTWFVIKQKKKSLVSISLYSI